MDTSHNGPEQQGNKIVTLEQAAQEMLRLHSTLDAMAVPMSPEEEQRIMSNPADEGVTWGTFNNWFHTRVPFLPRVMRHSNLPNMIMLGGFRNIQHELRRIFDVSREHITTTDGRALEDATVMHKFGRGYVVGTRYAVTNDGTVLQGDYIHYPRSRQASALYSPTTYLAETFHPITEVTDELRDFLAEVNEYTLPDEEPAADQA